MESHLFYFKDSTANFKGESIRRNYYKNETVLTYP